MAEPAKAAKKAGTTKAPAKKAAEPTAPPVAAAPPARRTPAKKAARASTEPAPAKKAVKAARKTAKTVATPAEEPRPEVLSGEILPAQPKAVQPAQPAEPATLPSLRDFRNRPMHAAELLALAAVAHYGPAAAQKVAWLREQYPSAAAEGIARAAAHRFVRQARTRGAVAGLAGPLAVLLDAGALHALHAELILNIAAAHGKDPTAPERAAELLYLLGVHDTAADADTAVRSAIRPGDVEPAARAGDPAKLGRPLARTLTLGVLRVGARRVLRLIPGAGALIGAIANARATDEMVTRALRHYRKTG
jgi:EcsC protein family